jgi:drug/metabolite transporter (DMT)-like permease
MPVLFMDSINLAVDVFDSSKSTVVFPDSRSTSTALTPSMFSRVRVTKPRQWEQVIPFTTNESLIIGCKNKELKSNPYFWAFMERVSLYSWFLLGLLSIIWGSSFILMKLGLMAFSSSEVAIIRLLSAFSFVLFFIPFHIKKFPKRVWLGFLASGLLGNFFPAFLFTLAETKISSSVAGLLNSFTPPATLLAGVIIWKIRPGRFGIPGVVLGLFGAGALFLASKGQEGPVEYFYCSLVLLATACYWMSVNIIKRYLQEISPLTNAIWSMTFAGLPCLFLIPFFNFGVGFTHPQATESLSFTIILGVVGSAISVILFNQLIRSSTALFASSVTYLIPVVSLMWGMGFGEDVGPLHFISLILILLGVWLINKKG